MKRLLVLRPEPGNRETVERALDMGLLPVACPLFAVEAAEWTAPDPRDFNAILFTSANALRHGGKKLAGLTTLPALAVGPATADAARAKGFSVATTGNEGVGALLAALPERKYLLHLTGVDHHSPPTKHAVEAIPVYRSVALLVALIPPGELVVMVHSPRAGERLSALVADRSTISVAAISAAAAAACGPGWAAMEIADRPNDSALLAVAARLCQD